MNHSTTPLTGTSTKNDTSLRIGQELIEMEGQGFFGFESMEEVSAYRNCITNGIFVESVVTATARNFGGPVHAGTRETMELMSIVTHTRGLVWCALPADSPHAKDFKAFHGPKSAGEGYNGPPQSFTMWWLGEGGKFHVTGLAGNTSGVLDKPQNQLGNYPTGNYGQPSLGGVTSQVLGAGTSQVEHGPMQGTQADESDERLDSPLVTPAPPRERRRPGVINTMIPQAPGAYRIWKEMNDKLPIHRIITYSPAHPVNSRAPPATVDLRLLGDVYVTVFELLTYFPCHGQRWQDYIKRFNGAGWGPTEMYKLAYIIRGQITNEMSAKVAKLVKAEGSMHSRAFRFLEDSTPNPNLAKYLPYQDLACGNWVPPVSDRSTLLAFGQNVQFLSDYYLSDVVDGVMPHLMPIGPNAGPLTAVIRWALDHPDECKDLKLSDVPAFSKKMGFFKTSFAAGLATSGEAHADVESLLACRAALGN